MFEMFKMEEQISALADVLSEDELRPIIKATLNNPLKYFCPNGAQERFIKTVANSIKKSRVPVILCTFANGVGKSLVSVMVMLNIIYKPQNGWFDYPLFHNYPFPKTIWYASTVEAIKETVVPMIEQFAKPGTYKIYKEGKAYASKIVFNYKGQTWTLVFKTFDQDVKQYESATVGCIEENERILMADGVWKKIIDVEVGDDIIAYGSKYAYRRVNNREERMPKGQNINKITAKVVTHNRTTLEIKGSGGFSVKCTPDHRFWIYGKGWTEAQDIIPDMKLVRQDIDIKGENTCTLWQSFLLGALIGDGCLVGKSVHFTSYNDILNSQIREMLPDGYEMSKIKPNKLRLNRQEYLFTTKKYKENQIKNWLKELGIWGHKSNTKFIPDIIFKGNNKIKIKFIEALFATDGWFSGRAIGYASTSKKLVEDLRLLLQEIGINSSIYFKKKQDPKWNNQWFLIIHRSNEVIRFCQKITVESKKEAQKKVLNVALRARKNRKTIGNAVMGGILNMEESLAQRKTRKKVRVTSVSLCNNSTVVDIQTDPNHNFVVNGIMTHNCFIIDEPMPEELWKASKSRRRLGCVTMLPMTPLLCPPYVLDEIQKSAEEGKDEYFHLTADVYQACKKRGIRGHLEPDIIDSMVEGYDEEEREARAFGAFMYFSGTIYPELNKDKHFVDPAQYPIPMYSQIFEVKDPHDGRPSAIIWGAKTPNGRFIIFRELPADKSMPFWRMTKPISAKDEIRQIFETENEFLAQMNAPVKNFNYQFEINRRILDKRFGWQKRAGTTLSALYMKEAIKLANEYPMFRHKQMVYVSSYDAPAGEGEIAFGHERVRDALADMADGKPGLVIYNTCYHTWNGMTHYIKQKRTGKSAEGFAVGDGKILLKYKDLPDTVRYLICANVLKSDIPTEHMTSHQRQKQEIINMPDKEADYTHS